MPYKILPCFISVRHHVPKYYCPFFDINQTTVPQPQSAGNTLNLTLLSMMIECLLAYFKTKLTLLEPSVPFMPKTLLVICVG